MGNEETKEREMSGKFISLIEVRRQFGKKHPTESLFFEQWLKEWLGDVSGTPGEKADRSSARPLIYKATEVDNEHNDRPLRTFKLPPHRLEDREIAIEPIFGKDDDFSITLSREESLSPETFTEFARRIVDILNERWAEPKPKSVASIVGAMLYRVAVTGEHSGTWGNDENVEKATQAILELHKRKEREHTLECVSQVVQHSQFCACWCHVTPMHMISKEEARKIWLDAEFDAHAEAEKLTKPGEYFEHVKAALERAYTSGAGARQLRIDRLIDKWRGTTDLTAGAAFKHECANELEREIRGVGDDTRRNRR